MMRGKRLILTAMLVFALASASLAARAVEETLLREVDIKATLLQMPDGARWLKHVEEDLIPFWTMKDALGVPVGNFPTYRANDGTLVDWQNPPEEFKPGVYNTDVVFPEREYLRSKSRQIFAYCVAYQLTGKFEYLEYAQKGIHYNYLREGSFYQSDTGRLYSYYDRKAEIYRLGTSQDWAYGLCGPAYYYALTRDQRIGDMLAKSKDALFAMYDDPGFGAIRWVVAPNVDKDQPEQREIVSTLDQIYSYMLLAHRSLPAPVCEAWRSDLQRLAKMLITEFYGSRRGLFWGTAGKTADRNYRAGHTDFGHSTKTMWLIMRVGQMTGDMALYDFGRNGAMRLVDAAYDPIAHTWNQKYEPKRGELRILKGREWWTLAILDQVAATLALDTPDFLAYLPGSTDYWLNEMVDKKNHEIVHYKPIDGGEPEISLPKQHSWKNAFHSFEHALVMYLTTQQFRGEDATLYFAMPCQPERRSVQPYIYEAETVSVEPTNQKMEANLGFPQLTQYKARFRNIR